MSIILLMIAFTWKLRNDKSIKIRQQPSKLWKTTLFEINFDLGSKDLVQQSDVIYLYTFVTCLYTFVYWLFVFLLGMDLH